MTSPVKRGFEFTHDKILDPYWRIGLGGRALKGKDVPKAPMKVTHATERAVWYGVVEPDGSARGDYVMDRDKFEARFAAVTT